MDVEEDEYTRAPSRVRASVVSQSQSQLSSQLPTLTMDQLVDDLIKSIYVWAEKNEDGSVKDTVERFVKVMNNSIMMLTKQDIVVLQEFSSYILRHNIKPSNFFYIFDMIINPLEILYGNAAYYLPESGEQIKVFCRMFNDIFKYHSKYINNIFKVENVFPQLSKNGKAFVINPIEEDVDITLKRKLLVVKVALTPQADSLSYEYYIGRFLNLLRYLGKTDVFALMYGRFRCGFNINRVGDPLCIDGEKKVHIITEYVRNVRTGVVLSVNEYIKMKYNVDEIYRSGLSSDEKRSEILYYLTDINIRMKNILLMVLISLQKAQDMMSFTHYDLHLGNVLIVEHDDPRKYDDNLLYYTPHIIDYGRCYIDTSNILDKYMELYNKDKIIYVDDNGKVYKSFVQMQDDIYGKRKFSVDKYESVEIMVQEYIYNMLSEEGKKTITQELFNKYRKEVYEKYVGNKKRILSDEEKTKYFPNAKKLRYGVPDNIYELVITNPTIPNYQHDLFKFSMTLCNVIISRIRGLYTSNMLNEEDTVYLLKLWESIRELLDDEFPIYIEGYNLIFNKVDNNIKNPDQLIKIITTMLDTTGSISVASDSISQLTMTGGGNDDKNDKLEKNEIKNKDKNSEDLKDNKDSNMHNKLKKIDEIPNMYYSVSSKDDYKQYILNEMEKMKKMRIDPKVELRLKKMLRKSKDIN
jgi:hypothetical protein